MKFPCTGSSATQTINKDLLSLVECIQCLTSLNPQLANQVEDIIIAAFGSCEQLTKMNNLEVTVQIVKSPKVRELLKNIRESTSENVLFTETFFPQVQENEFESFHSEKCQVCEWTYSETSQTSATAALSEYLGRIGRIMNGVKEKLIG